CNGPASSATAGTVTGTSTAVGRAAPVRTTKASSTCEAKAGGCGVTSDSQVSDRAAEPSRDERVAAATLGSRKLSASSTAGSEVECAAAACVASGKSVTTGGASGDVTGVGGRTGTYDW